MDVYIFFLQGDADIFFPTDFWFLERMDHYCSGWHKPLQDKSSNKGKKRRTLTVISLPHNLHQIEVSSYNLCLWLNAAWYISFHGRIWSSIKDKNKRWIQSSIGWLQEHQNIPQCPNSQHKVAASHQDING